MFRRALSAGHICRGVGYFIRVSLALPSLAILLPAADRKARGPAPRTALGRVKPKALTVSSVSGGQGEQEKPRCE